MPGFQGDTPTHASSVYEVHSQSEDSRWGWLVSVGKPTKIFCLNSPITAGRDIDTCNLYIDQDFFTSLDPNFPDAEYAKLSRQHFSMEKRPGDSKAVLKDLSKNGTWVDGVRVGENYQMVLNHCSVISIHENLDECFLYLDKVEMERKFPECVANNYLVANILGDGQTSVVRLAFKVVGKKLKTFALKMIKFRRDTYSRVLRDASAEVRIMKRLSHPCILKFVEVMVAEHHVIIVMEHAAGGELFNYVADNYQQDNLSEKVTKIYFYQIVHCVQYLHSRAVCHRDLKLENILLTNSKDLSIMKVTDFGFSKSFESAQDQLVSYVGTPVYMAPEVCKLDHKDEDDRDSPYSPKVDCWSLGVVLYTMLSGRRPFEAGPEMKSKILSGQYRQMSGRDWNNVSAKAKHLVRCLLEVDPLVRLSTEEIMEHPWIAQDEAIVSLCNKLMFGDVDEEEFYAGEEEKEPSEN